MAELVSAIHLSDLTRIEAEGEGAEGGPRPIYTLACRADPPLGLPRSYTPSGGGPPRLVVKADGQSKSCLHVWDTGTGAFLRTLEGRKFNDFITYQRPSDGRPRIAAGSNGGHLCIWDGDDFSALHTIWANHEKCALQRLVMYEEPTSGSTRLVTG
jgi:WD40 repeat protein